MEKTPKKSSKKKTKNKSGPIPKSRKIDIDAKLTELYYENGITATQASIIAGCSRQYASEKFKEIGSKIVDAEEMEDDWFGRDERTRKRMKEGLSIQIINTDKNIERMTQRLKKAQEIQAAILPDLVSKVSDSKLGRILENVDMNVVMEVYKIISNDLNMWKNYGYHVDGIETNIRNEVTFKAELQAQYDTIELTPPLKQQLEQEIERRIAEKNNLKPKESMLEK